MQSAAAVMTALPQLTMLLWLRWEGTGHGACPLQPQMVMAASWCSVSGRACVEGVQWTRMALTEDPVLPHVWQVQVWMFG
jgi:hypothetical protein